MKKILIITYYWSPSGGAGVQRWLKFAKYLPQFGYQPIILTVDESQASYAQIDNTLSTEIDPEMAVYRTQTFEPYNLYKKISSQKEIPYGGFSNEKKSSVIEKISRFIRGNIFLPDPRRGWNKYAIECAKKIIAENNINQIVTTGPPHSTHLIGLALKKQLKINWIADFRDPWTDIYYYNSLFHTKLAKWYDKKLESKVLNHCDKIISVGAALKNMLNNKINNKNSDKISVITNGFDSSDFQDINPIINDKFTITYTGTISKIYRIEGFIEAINMLPEYIKNQIVIRFVGNVPNEIISLFNNFGLSAQLEIIGYVPHKQAINFMAGASLLLLAIPDVVDNDIIITGKFFEYLAAKRPILIIGPQNSEIDKIATETKAGVVINYDNIEKIKNHITNHFDLYIKDGFEIKSQNIEKYSRYELTSRLARMLDNDQ